MLFCALTAPCCAANPRKLVAISESGAPLPSPRVQGPNPSLPDSQLQPRFTSRHSWLRGCHALSVSMQHPWHLQLAGHRVEAVGAIFWRSSALSSPTLAGTLPCAHYGPNQTRRCCDKVYIEGMAGTSTWESGLNVWVSATNCVLQPCS